MSERIDHAAEARRLAEMASSVYNTIEHRNGEMAVAQELENQTLAVTAQAHATLALVEQQRIANLMSLAAQAEPSLRAYLFGEAMDALGVNPKAGR